MSKLKLVRLKSILDSNDPGQFAQQASLCVMDQEHSTPIYQTPTESYHHHHHHSSEMPRRNRMECWNCKRKRERVAENKNKWHLICIYRQIVNQLQQFLCPYLSVLPVSFGARGDRPYIHNHPMQQQGIHTCRTRCCGCRCRALYSNDGNNHKNANIICHFLFQHATYHHPSAVKCYILKYKFNSYFMSLSSRIVVVGFCLPFPILNARPILLGIITIKKAT